MLRRNRSEPHFSGDQSVSDHVVVTVMNWPRGPGKTQYNWTEVEQENDGRGAGGWGSGGRSQREKPPALNPMRFSASQLRLFLRFRVSIHMASSIKFQLWLTYIRTNVSYASSLVSQLLVFPLILLIRAWRDRFSSFVFLWGIGFGWFNLVGDQASTVFQPCMIFGNCMYFICK